MLYSVATEARVPRAFLSHPRFPSPLFSRRPKKDVRINDRICVHSSATKRFYTFFSFCIRAREFFTHLKNLSRYMTVSSKQRRFQLEKKKYVGPRQRQQLERTIYDRLSHSVLEQYFCWKPIFVAHFRYICLIPPRIIKKKPS